MIRGRPSRRRSITLGLLVLLFLVGFALAARRGPRPAPNARYTGTVVVQTRNGRVLQRLDLVVGVDRSGRAVGAPALSAVPSRCRAGRTAGVGVGAGSAPIRAPGRFLLTVPLLRATRLGLASAGSTARRLDRVGELTIGGSFGTLGRLSGAVVDRFAVPGLRACGTGGGYAARAAASGPS